MSGKTSAGNSRGSLHRRMRGTLRRTSHGTCTQVDLGKHKELHGIFRRKCCRRMASDMFPKDFRMLFPRGPICFADAFRRVLQSRLREVFRGSGFKKCYRGVFLEVFLRRCVREAHSGSVDVKYVFSQSVFKKRSSGKRFRE